MSRRIGTTFFAALAIAALAGRSASADVYITEFLSNTGGGGSFEFIEFTNTGALGVNMAGWSQSDSDNDPGTHDLSGFGTLAPGESAILTEGDPDLFRAFWWGSVAAAPAGLKILGPYGNENLSSSGDIIHLYDNTTTLRDILTYPNGGGTANGVTRNPGSPAVLGTDQNVLWVNSALADSFGSFRASQNTNLIGNPGRYVVPEPGSIVLAIVGLALTGVLRRRGTRQIG